MYNDDLQLWVTRTVLQSSADPCTESSSSLMLSEKDGFAVDEHLLEAL